MMGAVQISPQREKTGCKVYLNMYKLKKERESLKPAPLTAAINDVKLY